MRIYFVQINICKNETQKMDKSCHFCAPEVEPGTIILRLLGHDIHPTRFADALNVAIKHINNITSQIRICLEIPNPIEKSGKGQTLSRLKLNRPQSERNMYVGRSVRPIGSFICKDRNEIGEYCLSPIDKLVPMILMRMLNEEERFIIACNCPVATKTVSCETICANKPMSSTSSANLMMSAASPISIKVEPKVDANVSVGKRGRVINRAVTKKPTDTLHIIAKCNIKYNDNFIVKKYAFASNCKTYAKLVQNIRRICDIDQIDEILWEDSDGEFCSIINDETFHGPVHWTKKVGDAAPLLLVVHGTANPKIKVVADFVS